MKIPFSKYHGAGNDFVLIDNRENLYNLDAETIAEICNRRVGVGADGLMLLQKSENTDFQMVYYNSDGHTAEMCGNGGRCIVAFAKNLDIVGNETTFQATDAVHSATILEWNGNSGIVKLAMSVSETVKPRLDGYFINTGVPHYVEFVDKIENFDVFGNGRKLRNHPNFAPAGTNVNFIEQISENQIFARTYERGVEDETLSCGTGVTASALVWAMKNGQKSGKVDVKTLGGDFRVHFKENANGGGYSEIFLQGLVKKVFEGIW